MSTNKKYVAISITTAADYYHQRKSTRQSVTTLENYNQMCDTGRTKGHLAIESLSKLSPICSSKEEAMSYIDQPKRTVRTTKINKGCADYIVYCIHTGKMNKSGKTNWDWNFWEEWKDSYIYFGRNGRSFLMGVKDSLKEGDRLFSVDNDTHKKLAGAPDRIDAVCKCNMQDFTETVKKEFPWLLKHVCGNDIDWSKLGQFYSIKGVSE